LIVLLGWKKLQKKKWVPEFRTKSCTGEIRQVKHHKNTGAPKFIIHFESTKQTVQGLPLDYVIKYSVNVPLKYHSLKAEYIVRLAREASAPPKRGEGEAAEERPEMQLDYKMEQSNTIAVASRSSKKPTTKRGGNERVAAGKQKKRIVSPVTEVSVDEKSEFDPAALSDVYEDIDDSEFDSDDDADNNELTSSLRMIRSWKVTQRLRQVAVLG
jgi:hypothetical protein